MIKKAYIIFIGLLICMFLGKSVHAQQSQSSLAEVEILNVLSTQNKNQQTHATVKNVTLKVLSGALNGKIVTIQDNVVPLPYELQYKKGDHMMVTVSKNTDGKDQVYLTDYDRRPMLALLFFLFLLFTVLVAKKQGLTSLIAMIISFFIIVQLIIPNILAGSDPFVVTLIASLVIIPATYYLAHGLNKKTTIAIIGTFITLILVGLLSYVFAELTKLTGFANEDAVYLQTVQGGQINIKSLLLAGIMIGALAVLNDITVSQASIVSSLRKSNPNQSKKELFEHAMNVGRDHVASLVNTLILVYVGASLPLVLLFYQKIVPFSFIVNQEIIATEIVRTLVSSIGIVAAVPITTYLATVFGDR